MAKPNQDKIISQLKRIRGQIDGLIRMYDDERACIDIVRQVVAARNSLGRVARDLLTQEATKCSQEKNLEKFDQVLKELFKH